MGYIVRGRFAEDVEEDGFGDTRWVELEELVDKIDKRALDGALSKWRKKEKAQADKLAAQLRAQADA